uniref:Acetylglutamate kinase n=1 Tax=Bostrychia moritziana TaxID=103713 RepID=A0A1Z1M6U6_BOSMO|nr:acetylglutamate kinase [Bostrychia moritziana]ARW61736.1 acetylglutamate kinase [Bostrychia moritziana]
MSNFLASDRFDFLDNILLFLRRYSGSTFVIKYGGSVMQDSSLKSTVIEDICFLYSVGINLVLVHGGGIAINSWLDKLNIKPKFMDGLRITDSNTMEVVEMVLMGKVNKELVSLINSHNISAVGLSGKDANLIQASPLFDSPDNLVGKVNIVNNKILNLLLSNRYIPVIASVSSDSIGQTYNINADTVASAIASSLKADKLILLTDTPGILRDLHNSSSVIKCLNLNEIKDLKQDNIISGGMIPKVDSCVKALQSEVKSAHIIDGRVKHALLYELFTNDRLGSMVVC